jgi:glycosyltransferase involved in cell wall biosynthesis
MRILYSSNAVWCNTGYGVQGKYLIPRLSALECVGGAENVVLYFWYGLSGGTMRLGPHLALPGFGGPYGADLVGEHVKRHGIDAVITLVDVWTQGGVAESVAPATWLPWFPVDTEPVSPRVLEALRGAGAPDGAKVASNVVPVTYSKHGQRMLADAGVGCAYVPHGVDPSVYRILAPDETMAVDRVGEFTWLEFREFVAPGASHLSVMVAANKGFDRKAFAEQFEAWSRFASDKPGARLYVHADLLSVENGPNLQNLANAVGIGDRVIFPDRYSLLMGMYPPEYLALLYNAADVLIACSKTEGFGVPLIEAQACGCPVVTTDFASMPELVRHGIAVRPAGRMWHPHLESWWAVPDVGGIAEAMAQVCGWGSRRVGSRGRDASAGIHQEFSWDVVSAGWQRVLEGVKA